MVILILNCLSLLVLKINRLPLRRIKNNWQILILSTIRAYLTDRVHLTVSPGALTPRLFILMLLDNLLLKPIRMVIALWGHGLVYQVAVELLLAAVTVHTGVLVKVLEKVAVGARTGVQVHVLLVVG